MGRTGKDVSRLILKTHSPLPNRLSCHKSLMNKVYELRLIIMKRKCRLADMVVRRHLSFCLFLPSKNSPAPYLTMKLIEWVHRLRTNNGLERIMKEIRRRTRVVGSFPDGYSAMMLVGARLRHISTTKWGTRQYMNTCKLDEGGIK